MIDMSIWYTQIMETKTCRRCQVEKAVDQFHKLTSARDGLQSWCAACKTEEMRERYRADPQRQIATQLRSRVKYKKDRKEYNRLFMLRTKYGLSGPEYEEMFNAQGRQCAICGSDNPRSQRDWHVDHRHSDGVVRGILCNLCNTGLGMFQDDPARMQAAIEYLERGRD